jgi:AcrR family transcriptional regulator
VEDGPVTMSKPRRTQEERSAAMRARLLDATIESLIDLGYSATTTTVIADRAGVSRGAQLHHFPTKAELVAAAVEHLANRIGGQLRRDLARDAGPEFRLADVVDALWTHYESPLFAAWLELSVAARTDDDLRVALAPVEKRLRAAMQYWMASLSNGELATAELELWQLTFYVLQGLALERTVLTEGPRRRKERERSALAAWKRILTDRAAAPAPAPAPG